MKSIIVIFCCIILFSCDSNTKTKKTKILNCNIAAAPGCPNHNMLEDTFETTLKSRSYTRFVFLSYTLKLHNFNVYRNGGNGILEYDGDTTQVTLDYINPTGLITINGDTVNVDQDDSYNLGDIIYEITPENKTDVFTIAYSFKVSLEEAGKAAAGSVGENWQVMTKYKEAPDSLNYFFKIPEIECKDNGANDIKTVLNLRDTLINNPETGDTEYRYFYKNKKYIMTPIAVYLRIQRFDHGQVKDTKYIILTYFDYGGGDALG